MPYSGIGVAGCPRVGREAKMNDTATAPRGRACNKEEGAMSIVKVIEVIGESETSFDDAVKNVLAEVSKTVSDIREIWVDGMKAIVKDNRVVEYRINGKVSFVVKN
jgi:dodecin